MDKFLRTLHPGGIRDDHYATPLRPIKNIFVEAIGEKLRFLTQYLLSYDEK
jgi:hypothetical protein